MGGEASWDGTFARLTADSSAERVVSDLFRELAPQIRRWVTYQHGTDVADEVLAETFLVVWRRHAVLSDVPAERRAWVFGIAANVTRQHIRGAIRALQSENKVRSLRLALTALPEDHVAEMDWVHEMLKALPPAEREVFTLVVLSDLSPAQVAQVLDCPPGVVRSRLSRARARLGALALHKEGHTSAGREG